MNLIKHLCVFLAIALCTQLCAIQENNSTAAAQPINDTTQQAVDTTEEILEIAATFIIIAFIEQNFYGAHHNDETEQLLAKALSCLETEDNFSEQSKEFETAWHKYVAQNGYPSEWPEEMKSLKLATA